MAAAPLMVPREVIGAAGRSADQAGTFGQVLDEMTLEVETAGGAFGPSEFWKALNRLNRAQLDEFGFETFKRTANQNYFNWLIWNRHDTQVRAMLREAIRHPAPRILTARLLDAADTEAGWAREHPFAVRRVRLGYAVFVAALWEFARRRDRLGLLERLEEPSLGDPILVRHRGRLISQDIANSVLEFYAIADAVPSHALERGIVELGGGYGRLAWVFLQALPSLRYVMVDIPPALAIAQRYLTSLLPDVPAFGFRHIERWEDVDGEAAAARLVFLTPNQLAMAPLTAGLFVNVSSLHEMRPEAIAHYIGEVSRVAHGGYFYTKQWIEWHNDRDGITLRRGDYPIPHAWTQVYNREHPVQRHFFEALYQLP